MNIHDSSVPEDAQAADLSQYLSLFSGREGVFAREFARSWQPVRPERSLTEDELSQHLRGDVTLGTYVVRRDNTCTFVCLDLDIGKGKLSGDPADLERQKAGLTDPLLRLRAALADEFGTTGENVLLEDTGGRGYHIWVFFVRPVPARQARAAAYRAAEKATVECEIFPKQDRVEVGKYGSLIRLPLGHHRKYGNWSSFLRVDAGSLAKVANWREALGRIDRVECPDLVEGTAELADGTGAVSVDGGGAARATFRKAIGVGSIFDRCGALAGVQSRVRAGEAPSHDELMVLGRLLSSIEGGTDELHRLLSSWPNYDRAVTQSRIAFVERRGMLPPTCRWLIDRGICQGYCTDDIAEAAASARGHQPSPIRHAKWRSPMEADGLLPVRDASFDDLYARQNLRRAWQQMRQYTREEDVVLDEHEIDAFEQRLDANIECLRHELQTESWKPGPYRIIEIPKAWSEDKFEFRRKATMHPRDHAVAQAVVNAIGAHLEVTFSPSSHGRRLELREGAGSSIFRPWQEDWGRVKNRVLSFQFYPRGYTYVRADVKSFFDRIDHTRLMGLLTAQLKNEPRILKVLYELLKAPYVADDGGEVLEPAKDRGIPQGPSFSPVLANLYLDVIDKYMETRCVDYVRYVDDIAFVAPDEAQGVELTEALEGELRKIGLELNPLKTDRPRPVSDAAGLLDFLGEVKYGAAGVLSRPMVAEQYPLRHLRDMIEDLAGPGLYDAHRLDELGKNLRFYLDAQKSLPQRDDYSTAVDLAQAALDHSPMRPRDFLACIQTIIVRYRANEEELLRRLCHTPPHTYALVVTALTLVADGTDVDRTVAERLLRVLSRWPGSYIVRGLAQNGLRRIEASVDVSEATELLDNERSPFALARFAARLQHMPLAEMALPVGVALHHVDWHVTGAAASVALGTLDERLLANVVTAWRDRVVPTALLPLALECVIQVADSGAMALLQRQFEGDRTSVLGMLARSDLLVCPNVFKATVTGEYRYLALAKSALSIGDEAVRATIIRELAALRNYVVDDVAAERSVADETVDVLLGARPEPRSVPRYFADFEEETVLFVGFGGVRMAVAKRRGAAGERLLIEGVPAELLAEADSLRGENDWSDVLTAMQQQGVSTEAEVWEGEGILWAAYELPPDWRTVAEAFLSGGARPDPSQALMIAEGALHASCQAQDMGLKGAVPHPFSVLVGPGGAVKLAAFLTSECFSRYISLSKHFVEDQSATHASNFSGMLAFEMLTGTCPISELSKIRPEGSEKSRSLSQSAELHSVSQHYVWIIDRLTRPKPDHRYKWPKALSSDIEHSRAFDQHCRDKLSGTPPAKLYDLETADVISLRIGREVAARAKDEQCSHAIALSALYVTCSWLERANASAKARGIPWKMPMLSDARSSAGSWSLARWLHVSSFGCLAVSEMMENWTVSVAEWAKWPLRSEAAVLSAYCGLRVEVIATLRCIVETVSFDAWAAANSEGLLSLIRALRRLATNPAASVMMMPQRAVDDFSACSGPLCLQPVDWHNAAGVVESIVDTCSVLSVEDAPLQSLLVVGALLSSGLQIRSVEGMKLVLPVLTAPCPQAQADAKHWARAIEDAMAVEMAVLALIHGHTDADVTEARGYVKECLASVRRLGVVTRRRLKVAARFRPKIAPTLRLRAWPWNGDITILHSRILRFPAHHMECLPGERASADFATGQDGRVLTATLVPTCLRALWPNESILSKVSRYISSASLGHLLVATGLFTATGWRAFSCFENQHDGAGTIWSLVAGLPGSFMAGWLLSWLQSRTKR